MTTDVLVVGGRLTGMSTALALHRRGIGVRVLERTTGAGRVGLPSASTAACPSG